MNKLRSLFFYIALMLITSACMAEVQNHSLSVLDACHGMEEPEQYWLGVREKVKTVDANKIAPLLAECLRSSNPVLRDRIAYEVLTYWLRREQLSKPVKRDLVFRLQPWLSITESSDGMDPAIARAFSALVLSELVRADTLESFITEDEINALLISAAAMFSTEQDYRGLVPDIGWIHTIAHGSDLLWRFAIHPSIQREQLVVILNAVAEQLTKTSVPAYTFNEPDRISRVISAIAARPEVPQSVIENWLSRISGPAELSSWNNAFASIEGMAKLHNTKSLLRALRENFVKEAQLDLVSKVDEHLAELP